jgi:hypothetical protein
MTNSIQRIEQSSKQIGRWGCRQLNIHNARLLPKVRWMPEKDSRLFGSHLTGREPGSKLTSFQLSRFLKANRFPVRLKTP